MNGSSVLPYMTRPSPDPRSPLGQLTVLLLRVPSVFCLEKRCEERKLFHLPVCFVPRPGTCHRSSRVAPACPSTWSRALRRSKRRSGSRRVCWTNFTPSWTPDVSTAGRRSSCGRFSASSLSSRCVSPCSTHSELFEYITSLLSRVS